MTYVLMSALAGAGYVVIAYGFLRHLRALQREHSREKQTLVNQMMFLSGKTWQDAPVDQDFYDELAREREAADRRIAYVVAPEQAIDTYV